VHGAVESADQIPVVGWQHAGVSAQKRIDHAALKILVKDIYWIRAEKIEVHGFL